MGDFDLASHQVEHGPLAGKTVLVTRARAQSEEITTQLEKLGAAVINLPTIEVTPPDSWVPVDRSIENLAQYDWIVFTSANAVRFFVNRLTALRSESVAELLSTHLLCAIGPATARAIESAGAHPNVVARDSRAEGALKAIVDHVGGEANVRGLRVLIPRAKIAREALPQGLRSLGANVDAVVAYQTIKPDLEPGAVISLFTEYTIDAISFTSSSTVSNFAELAGLTDLSDLLATALVVCIGPTTAETAATYGLTRVIQPDRQSTASLVQAVVASLSRI